MKLVDGEFYWTIKPFHIPYNALTPWGIKSKSRNGISYPWQGVIQRIGRDLSILYIDPIVVADMNGGINTPTAEWTYVKEGDCYSTQEQAITAYKRALNDKVNHLKQELEFWEKEATREFTSSNQE